MSSDSIHDAVLCAERRGRTPARSIDAALLARLYPPNWDYLIINAVSLRHYLSVKEVCRCRQLICIQVRKKNSDIHVRCRVLVLVDESMQKRIES